MHLFDDDIIAAVATPMGSGGIGIVRVSGPGSIPLVENLFKSKSKKNLADLISHSMTYGDIIDDGGAPIDEVLVTVMAGPHTYTTQDVVEINCHGGMVATRAVLDQVLSHGARLAEPGEFTKRAFLGGRIDLSQAEAVMDVISAKTRRSLELSVGQLSGDLSKAVTEIDTTLIALLSDMEANIDYPEYDIEDVSYHHTEEILKDCIVKLKRLVEATSKGKIYREGLPTAIIGAPNVGKSSLLNYLIQEEKAIVTDIPGTTRDIIEEYINIDNIPFKIIDTAGIRDTEDVVERIGVNRSRQMMEEAELVLFMLDVSRETSRDEQILLEEVKKKKHIIIANKIDLEKKAFPEEMNVQAISIRENEGLEQLKKKMVEIATGEKNAENVQAIIVNARQEGLLKQAMKQLQAAMDALQGGIPMELLTIDIKGALESIRFITGESIGSDIIDEIFSKFCLGK
ncbi:MAG: tRNA uridine-5-carboxymethylaminomethyl(34) synthesis GTPase MnmE [Eubacterium aggregans]|uniref:tRNA uridine-5-carboxymethylaminomethyl(34) synthesis GTPase MnmE n=1 Tax=Eubacterium aggregans TaxID=81409 RepID=UPI002B206901|nr:tRNA uridine-5-carboxymethylaminomethyl(34) synthesis GTPase MnmE [Eubacterium aggregans]MEA5073552.1 tRNA uridine-5-carboxymethylaminomethyl(34) synthesis GTPase MnmE [Eubacterium aggregans]